MALITEESDPQIPGVCALRVGRHLDWSTRLIRSLDVVGTAYVLLTLEDCFLRGTVDSRRILSLFDEMRGQELQMLRLIPRPGPTNPIPGKQEYGRIVPGTPYSVSTQAAFWNADTLRRLLVPGESIWEFELKGASRMAAQDRFASVWRSALPYRHHVVEKGKWFPWSAWRFRRLNIGVDLSKRQVMTFGESTRWIIKKATKNCVAGMSHQTRQRLKPIARWCGF